MGIMANPPPHLACPTAIVETPIEAVWDLLLNTAEWGKFYDISAFCRSKIGNPGPMFLPLRLALT